MARPIWTGSLSFGLLNIPIQLMPGERRTDIHFRMLDARTNDPVRYERVNAETGEEVPWKEIVKAFEFSKDNYVVLQPEDIASAASDNKEMIALEAFVERESISPNFLERPYVLVPGKKAEKGYVLLREVMKKTGRVGIGRVVIRTREYLSMVIAEGDALMLILLRFPQEIVDPSEYAIPEGNSKQWNVTPKELEMAQTLLESMASEWKPEDYKDEFRERLHAVIKERIRSKTGTTHFDEDKHAVEEPAATNVVDFMALLQQSLKKKGGQPAKAAKTAPRAPAKKAAKKAPAKKAAAKKTTSRRKQA